MKIQLATACFVMGSLLAPEAVSIARGTEGVTSVQSTLQIKKDD